jgi:hypothetical protein
MEVNERMDEDQKKAIMEKRTANRKLAEVIRQGTRYHEALKMKLIDGQEHDIAIYPLSEDEFRILLETHGVNLSDLANKEKLTENMKFIEELARLATGLENISELVLGNGCADIMMKCFEASGLSPDAGKKVESFQQGDIQPKPVRADGTLRSTTR